MTSSLATSSAISPVDPFGERTRALFSLIGYVPTAMQSEVLACISRFIIVTGGIQAGKSTVLSKKLIKEFVPDLRRAIARAQRTGAPLSTILPLVYWLVGADYDATEREFRYLEADFQALGLLRRTVRKINPGTLEILGGRGRNTIIAQIKTKSAKDYQTLRKESPSGIMACEASQLDYFAYERLMERTAPAEAWMMMTGTMERGRLWYSQMAKEWGISGPDKAWFQMKSAGNEFTYPGGEDNPDLLRERAEMPASLYAERFEGIPQIPTGLVFPEFQPNLHVGHVEYTPGIQVQVWEDPGFGATSAHVMLAVQIVDGQIRVFDEIYVNSLTTETIIKDILRQKVWYKDIELRVGDPHYGSQHHANESVDDIWRKLEPKIRSKGERQRVNPRLERTRGMLIPTAHGAPKTLIDRECKGILSEVGLCVSPIDGQEHMYMYKVDNNGTVVGDEPVDKWNHAWEAFGRGAYFNFGPIGDAVSAGKRRFRSQFFTHKRKDGRRGR